MLIPTSARGKHPMTKTDVTYIQFAASGTRLEMAQLWQPALRTTLMRRSCRAWLCTTMQLSSAAPHPSTAPAKPQFGQAPARRGSAEAALGQGWSVASIDYRI